MTELPSIYRTCADCHRPWELTGAEQEFFQRLSARKGVSFALPRRCASCRRLRRAVRYGNPLTTDHA